MKSKQIQDDQKVSVHLMITKAKSGEQRHFDHPVQEFVICLVNKLRIERVKNSYEKFINI